MTALASTTALRRPGAVVGVAATLLAALVGAITAFNPLLGLAVVLALVYAVIAAINLPLAVGVWIPLLFLEGLPGALMLPEAGAAVVFASWLAGLARSESWPREQLRRNAFLISLVGALVVWMTLTLLWADDPGRSTSLLLSVAEVALFFVVVLTVIETPRHLRIVAMGFVAGTLLSACIGILGEAAGVEAVSQAGRMQGAAGDPNYFAAQLVAGMVLAVGLAVTTTNPSRRVALLACLLPLATGVVASGSRGGFVATAAVAVAALFVFKRQRLQVFALTFGVAALLGLWFVSDPSTSQRLLSASEDRGSGRADLWTIALRMTADNPVGGVGLNNFAVHASEYTRQPGTLTGLIHVEREQETHNAYIGLLAETGAVGLALFLAFAIAALTLGVRAATRFDMAGERRSATLVRAIVVAQCGFLSAAFFLPNAADKRVWVLLGVGVAALAVAHRVSDPAVEDRVS